MSMNLRFKVSYVTITNDGIERHNDVYLDDITMEERKDIKSLIFLPVDITDQIDITDVLKGFPILEHLYLPSTMVTTIQKAGKECPMLKDLLILTRHTDEGNLNKMVAKFRGENGLGNNDAEFRAFVENEKDGKQTFYVSSKQVDNHIIVEREDKIVRLSTENVDDFVTGNHGISLIIDEINENIADDRCKIDISKETLESLLTIFVEKGVTLNEFMVDFSKLYDKIESYKAIAKSVNQVSTKEQIEGNIVEAYKNVQNIHYNNLLKNLSEKIAKLVSVAQNDDKNMLYSDISNFMLQAIVEHPDFDENFRDFVELGKILDEVPSRMSAPIQNRKLRDSAKECLKNVAENLEGNKDNLYARIQDILDNKVTLDLITDLCNEYLDSGDSKALAKKTSGWVISSLISKNLGTITKHDVEGVLSRINKAMKGENFAGKKLQELIDNTIQDYLTEDERKDLVVDLIASRGYSAFKITA